MYAYVYIYIYIYMHMHIHTHTYMYVCMYVYTIVYIYIVYVLYTICIYIYIYTEREGERDVHTKKRLRRSSGSSRTTRKTCDPLWLRPPLPKPRVNAMRASIRKGTNGVGTNGVTANCLFFDRWTYWVLPLIYFCLPKSARAFLFPPICQNSSFLQRPH